MLLVEFFGFAFMVGIINYFMTGAEQFNFALALGAGCGAALGFALHQVKPWFKKPSTFFGHALAFCWFAIMIVGWGSLIGMFSDNINVQVAAFMLNLASMFFIRRYFLVVFSSK